MIEKLMFRLQSIIEKIAPILLAMGEEEFSEKPMLNKWSKKEIIGHLILLLIFCMVSLSGQGLDYELRRNNFLKCDSLIRLGSNIENQASSFLTSGKYNTWSNRRKIKASRKAYHQALNFYHQAELLQSTCSHGVEFKIIYCLNQLEKFGSAEKLLNKMIENGDYSRYFFNHYFMTINKESRIKTLRQDGRFIEICGGSPMYADAEYYHTEIILKNAIQLYRKKKYELLLIYLSHAKFRITWSEDNRLNQLNIVLCQLFLKSLLKFHTLDEILHEFDASSVAESESFFEGIGDSMNFPVKQMKLYGYELNFYHDSPLYKVNAYFKSNQHPIFDLKQSDSVEIKKHSILQNQLKEMVHLKK